MDPESGRAPSREHVFPESLGGRTVVFACSPCNNRRLGAHVEGKLQTPRSLLRLHRSLRGEPGQMMHGHHPETGQRVDIDLLTGVNRLHPQVTIEGDTRTVVGDPETVRTIIIGLGVTPSKADDLIAAAEPKVFHSVEMELVEPIDAHVQLSAKCALVAGVWLDPDFIHTLTADGLRLAIDDPVRARREGQEIVNAGPALNVIQSVLDDSAQRMGVDPVPIARWDCQVAYITSRKGLLVAVRVAGTHLLAGPCIPGGRPPVAEHEGISVVGQSTFGLAVHRPLLDLAIAGSRLPDDAAEENP